MLGFNKLYKHIKIILYIYKRMSEVIATSTVEITPPTLTKEELKKQKCAIYQKEYMREYHKKRYNTDEEYRQYRIEMTKKTRVKCRKDTLKHTSILKTTIFPYSMKKEIKKSILPLKIYFIFLIIFIKID